MRRPSTVIVPAVGGSRPPMRFRRVVLPEPDGPMRATKSARSMSRSMPCRTSMLSRPRRYVLVTPRISISALISPRRVGERDPVAVGERGRGRDDDALAGGDAAQHLAVGAGGLAEGDRAGGDLPVGDHEDDGV